MTLFKSTNSKKILAFLVALIMFLGFVAPTNPITVSANNAEAHVYEEVKDVIQSEITPSVESQVRAYSTLDTVAGSNTYSLFNSGRSGDTYAYSTSWGRDYNPDSRSFNNNGYDLCGATDSGYSRTVIGMGGSFCVTGEVTERVTLTTYGYDVDEESGENDQVYLIDETTGQKTYVGDLQGRDSTWATTTIYIDASNFESGHVYSFEVSIAPGWITWIRTVSLQLTIDGEPNGGGSSPIVLDHNFEASISSTGLVSTNLYLKTSINVDYVLEYTANISNTQRGGTQGQVINATNLGVTKQVSFQLESGAPKGTYLVVVILKDNLGNTVGSYQASAGYDFHAVSYNSNGGSNNLPIDTNSYSVGNLVNVKFDYVPSKTDYEFLGWSTDPSALTPTFAIDGNNSFTMGSSDVVLYAVWKYNPGNPDSDLSDYAGGSGTQADPYLIASAEQLEKLAESTNNGNTHEGEYFKLTADIDLKNREWVPIGQTNMNGWEVDDYYVGFENYFAGHFDGDNHIIYNFTQSQCYFGRTGLFGCLKGATVENVGIAHARISAQNVFNGQSANSGKNTVAGVLAGTAIDSLISKCYTSGVLNIYHLSQGAGSAVGGMIGIINDSSISNCFSEVAINVENGEDANVKSYNTYVGGIVGEAEGEIVISNVYYSGDVFVKVIADKSAFVSGIVGLVESITQTSLIEGAFAIGMFDVCQGDATFSGIYQYWEDEIPMDKCYCSVDFKEGNVKTSESNVTLLQLQTQSFIEQNLGWDFASVWEMDDLTRYPVLVGFDQDVRADFVHVESDWIIDYQPTCDQYGKKHTECAVCGAYVRVASISPNGHSYQEIDRQNATCTQDGYVVSKCSECDKEITIKLYKTGHYYGLDNVCDYCGDEIEEHTHTITETVIDPTCSTIGYTLHQCSCGYSYTTDIVSEYGHRWDNGVVTIEATCTTNGRLVYTCQECSTTRTQVITSGHNFEENIVIEATCTVEGIKNLVCSRCHEVRKEIIPAGHDWDGGNVVLEPTCETAGKIEYTCTVCGEVEEFEIAKLGHRFTNGECTVCHKGFIDVIIYTEDHPSGLYFKVDDVISNYGPDYINEYGALLDYNSDANIRKIAVYLTQEGNMWRRTIACVGSNIEYATFVPYLSYDDVILYSGLNSGWINTFRLTQNADGVWCYSNYATIGANLQDAQGNLLLALYDIGQAGANTRIFDDLQEMIEWLTEPYDCIVHQEGNWEVVEEPTCNQTGTRQIKCVECNKVLRSETIDATGICVADNWIIDVPSTCTLNGERHRNCKYCGVELERETVIATGHTQGQWEIVYDATCEDEGFKHVKCSVCGTELQNSVIPAHGHSESDWITVTEANCGYNGEEIKECTICHRELDRQVISATGNHVQGELTVVEEATCSSAGVTHIVCTVCNKVLFVGSIDKLPHTESDWIIETEETCEDDGLKYICCDVCGERIQEEIIHATGHTEGDWIVDEDPTCLEKGSKHTECTVCSAVVSTGDIDATGHTEGDWIVDEDPTCLGKGSKHTECTVCSAVVSTGDIDATGHTESDWIVDEEPTCTETGIHHTDCLVCGDRIRIESIPENGHTKGSFVVDIYPTCTTDGSKHASCVICGVIVETQAIAMLGHAHGDWQIAVEATTTASGERIKECSRCSHTIAETIPMLAKISITSAQAGVGEYVEVTVSMADNHGFIGSKLTIEYGDGLELIGVELGEVFATLDFVHPTSLNSGCSFVWSGDSADTTNGVIFVLKFRISTTAVLNESYQVNVTYDKEDVLYEEGHCVDIHVEEGYITANSLKGDANGDGVVDVADVMALRYFLAGGYDVTINEVQADVDGDGEITVADVVLLRAFIVNGTFPVFVLNGTFYV